MSWAAATRIKPGTAGPAPVDSHDFHLARLRVARYCRDRYPGDDEAALSARRELWLMLAAALGIDGDQAAGERMLHITGAESPDTQVRASRPGGAA